MLRQGLSLYLGKTSSILGLISLFLALIVGFSITKDDGINGPLLDFISNLLNFNEHFPQTEHLAKPLGFFNINENNMRVVVIIISIILAIISGILAIIASKKESNSLWYSLGVSVSGVTLSKFSYVAAGVFLVFCVVIIMNHRKWKLTNA